MVSDGTKMKNVRKCILFTFFMLLLSQHILVHVESLQQQVSSENGNVEDKGATTEKCCNQTSATTHRVEIEFTTTVIQNEYIVRFKGYYLPRTREKYLTAALNESQVCRFNVFIFHLFILS